MFRHRLVEGGIEHGHVRDVGQQLTGPLDALRLYRVVKRSQRRKTADVGQHLVVDHHWVGVLVAAVHHSMANGGDLAHLLDNADLGISQPVQCCLERLFVIRAFLAA